MIKKSIASKFAVLLILSVCISVLVSSVIITGYLLHRFSKDVHEKDMLHIKGLSGTVKGFMDHAFSLNYQLSINPEIIEAVQSADKKWEERTKEYNEGKEINNGPGDTSGMPLLVKMQKQYSFAELFFVQDAAGDQVARSFGPLGHRGKRWWFKEITAENNYKPFISKSYYSMTGDKPVTSAFHPIYKEGVFIGVMGTDINFENLQDMVQAYLYSKDLKAIVIDNEGAIIAHPDKKKLKEMYNLKNLTRNVLLKDKSGVSIQDQAGYHKINEVKINWPAEVSQIVKRALAGESGFVDKINLDGMTSTLYFDPVVIPGYRGERSNYAIILIRNNATIAHTKMVITAFVFLFTAITISALVAVFHFRFRKVVLDPLRLLTNSMQEADSAKQEDVVLETNDEFEILADTYNKMRINLFKANQEMRKLNEELENRVEARTEELKKINQRLKEGIARRKKIEDALRESEDRYRSTFETAPDAIALLSVTDGKYIEVNDKFRRLFGYSREEVMGRTPVDLNMFFSSSDRDTFLSTGEDKRELSGHEMKFYKKDGTVIDTLVSVRHLKYGNEDCLIAVVTDITQRKQTEAALMESEEKYRLLAENANDAIFIFQEGHIKFPNPKAKALWKELTGTSHFDISMDLFHPEDRKMVLERFKHQLAGKVVPDTCIFRVFSFDGKEKWMELNDVYVNWGGSAATLNFMRDITMQKKFEAQFEHSQRMDAIGTLAGGIAHNFNNLLMAIQGNISLIKLNEETVAIHKEELKSIERCIDSGANLTHQLLGFARGGKYNVKPCNLNNIVNSTARMFGQSKKEIKIHGNFQNDIWTVDLDEGQIELVLLNIYVNAGQAMEGGGDLYLQTENVFIDIDIAELHDCEPGKYVKVAVTDTGVGMDREIRNKIFEPFYTTKSVGQGTGLGLASAFGIIRGHGGFIEVDSRKGHGTRFDIYFPASKDMKSALDVERAEITIAGCETILLVDDENMIIQVCKSMLERLGYEVIIARGGRVAIDIYMQNKDKIDLVILDIIMPDMDGGKVFDRIREINPHAKVLLCSGCRVDEYASTILDRGCNGFVQKPFDLASLSNKIRGILDEDRIEVI